MDILKKLNDLRLQRNMSVYRLAELSEINQSTLANTFSRGSIPSIQNLEKICNTLGVSLAQFFTEDEVIVRLTPEEAVFFFFFEKLPLPIKKSIDDIVNSLATYRDN